MNQNIRTIRVGTFNLMNFMSPNRPAYNGTLYYSHDEYRRKSEWIEHILNEIDADIIGFQELFHREAMVHIIKNNPRYRKARLYMAEDNGEQPSVALLSRYPVENFEVFTHFPEEAVIDFNPRGRDKVILPFSTFTRPVIRAEIRIPNYGLITVFVVHLKSKREIFYNGEDPQNPVDLARAQARSLMLRASESVAVRALVADALEIPDRPVILCGDVNDTGNAVTSRIISGEVPQHRLSDSVKRRAWELLLYHVKDIQARRSYQDFYYTHIHNGMYESLDHIMVSQELVTEYPRNTGRVGLVSVYNDHLVDQTFTQHGVDKCKSDHGVVVCSIELNLDRAAKFIGDNADYYDEEDIREHTDVLDQLDENRTEAEDPTAEPELNETEAEADDENEEESSSFNMQNSLDRWRNNHPNSGRSQTLRRKTSGFGGAGQSRDSRDARTSGNRQRINSQTKSRTETPASANPKPAKIQSERKPEFKTPVSSDVSPEKTEQSERRIAKKVIPDTPENAVQVRCETPQVQVHQPVETVSESVDDAEKTAVPRVRRLFRPTRPRPVKDDDMDMSPAEAKAYQAKARSRHSSESEMQDKPETSIENAPQNIPETRVKPDVSEEPEKDVISRHPRLHRRGPIR